LIKGCVVLRGDKEGRNKATGSIDKEPPPGLAMGAGQFFTSRLKLTVGLLERAAPTGDIKNVEKILAHIGSEMLALIQKEAVVAPKRG